MSKPRHHQDGTPEDEAPPAAEGHRATSSAATTVKVARPVGAAPAADPGLEGLESSREREPTGAFHVGRVLGGRYELAEELGRGAFGLVFRAHDRMADETVAIKLLHYDQEQTPGVVEQLRSELRAARKVAHPGIVRIHDVAEIGGRLALSMEFVAGETLKVRLGHKGRLGEEELRKLGAELVRALHAAHGAGVVHCDLKPANIIIRSQSGQAVITDFGISRLQPTGADDGKSQPAAEDLAPAAASLGEPEPGDPSGLLPELFSTTILPYSPSSDTPERARRIFGTPLYMAPELFLPGTRVGPAIDVYALGVVLYEAATGLRPHERGDLRELMQRRLEEPPVPVSVLRPDLSPELCRVIDGCLAREPAERLTSEAILQALDPPRPVISWASAQVLGRYGTLLTLILALCGLGIWWGMTGLPLGERRVFIEATWVPAAQGLGGPAPAEDGSGAGGRAMNAEGASADGTSGTRSVIAAGDAWIGPAVAHLAAAQLRQRERRFVVVATLDKANVLVHLTVTPSARTQTSSQGVTITATVGRPDGRQQSLDPTEGTSASMALEPLLDQIRDRIGAGRSERPPDEVEAKGRERLGALSPVAYRHYTEAVDDYFRSVVVDSAAIEKELERAIGEDPGWAHPYAALALVMGRVTPRAREVLRRGRSAGDPRRDPLGRELLSSLELAAESQPDRAHQKLEQALQGASDDLLGLYLLGSSYAFLGRADEQAGIYGRLHAQRPDLQFGADLVSALDRAGRSDEVPAIIRSWLEHAPESEPANLGTIALDIAGGRYQPAERRARALILLHGDAPHRQITLCDVLLGAGRTLEARAVANKLLHTTDARARAFGLYRLGVIAVIEGRLAAAREALVDAAEAQRPFGIESELLQTLEALLSLDERFPSGDDREAHLEEIERTFTLFGMRAQAAATQYEQALLHKAGGSCPAPEIFLQNLDEARERTIAKREMLRAAASSIAPGAAEAAGCARCAEVLRAGLGTSERSTRSIYRFAACAEAEGALDLAVEAFRRASVIIALSLSTTNGFAPDLAVLAHFRLGRVLERLGKKAEARAAYDRFLGFWGHADRPIPEVLEARKALGRP